MVTIMMMMINVIVQVVVMLMLILLIVVVMIMRTLIRTIHTSVQLKLTAHVFLYSSLQNDQIFTNTFPTYPETRQKLKYFNVEKTDDVLYNTSQNI